MRLSAAWSFRRISEDSVTAFFGLAQVCEALGHACASTALCFGMHCVGSAVIAAKATPDQRERYLDPICAGEHLTTLALSEPGTGSHFYLPWYIFQIVVPYFLIAMAGSYLGVASAALEDAKKHLSQRRYQHTGSSLGQQAVIQHRLGTLWGQVERTRRLIYHAAQAGDAGEEEALLAVMSAKAEAADCAVNVTNEAMTLTGGMGYRDDSSLQRRMRDARASHVMAPTTDILRGWAGRALLGLPLLGE